MVLGRYRWVTAADASRKFGEVNDAALRDPVVLTKNGKARTVLLSVETFERLLANERTVFLARDTPAMFDAQLEAVAQGDFTAAGLDANATHRRAR